METALPVLQTQLFRSAEIADPEPASTPDTLLGVFDLVLRGQRKLTAALTDAPRLAGVTQRLLALALLGTTVHGVVVGATITVLDAPAADTLPWLWMPLALNVALLGALCVCLPSFYFYTQLSGLDASFRLVTAQALRAHATESVLLLGVLPFYAALALGARPLFGGADDVVQLGLALPFLVGLYGVGVVYGSFKELAKTLPVTHVRRGRFLGRLVLAWGAVFTAVAPVALWRLCEAFTHGRFIEWFF